MRGHLPAIPSQTEKRALIRRYGYGVPDLTRAIRSLSNDVTMVIEGNVQPYEGDGSDIKTKDMMLHDLPWPNDVLEAARAGTRADEGDIELLHRTQSRRARLDKAPPIFVARAAFRREAQRGNPRSVPQPHQQGCAGRGRNRLLQRAPMTDGSLARASAIEARCIQTFGKVLRPIWPRATPSRSIQRAAGGAKSRAPARRPASPILPGRQPASAGASRSLHADRNCHRNTCRGGSVSADAKEKQPGEESGGSEPITHVILACDKSGAKGYADQNEAIRGETGVFEDSWFRRIS